MGVPDTTLESDSEYLYNYKMNEYERTGLAKPGDNLVQDGYFENETVAQNSYIVSSAIY